MIRTRIENVHKDVKYIIGHTVNKIVIIYGIKGEPIYRNKDFVGYMSHHCALYLKPI